MSQETDGIDKTIPEEGEDRRNGFKTLLPWVILLGATMLLFHFMRTCEPAEKNLETAAHGDEDVKSTGQSDTLSETSDANTLVKSQIFEDIDSFLVDSLQEDFSFNLSGIQISSGEVQSTAQGVQQLNQLAKIMKSNRQLKLFVFVEHRSAENSGNSALDVKRFLMDNGISGNRIVPNTLLDRDMDTVRFQLAKN